MYLLINTFLILFLRMRRDGVAKAMKSDLVNMDREMLMLIKSFT